MKRLFGFVRATTLVVSLQCLAGTPPLLAADAAEPVPDVIGFSDASSDLRLQPVSPLDSFLRLTLEPHALIIKVRDRASDSFVEGAPLRFEVTSVAGTLSTSPDFSANTSLQVATDSTGAATVYFHPSEPFDVPAAVRATIEGTEPLTFLFFPALPPSIGTHNELASPGGTMEEFIAGGATPINPGASGTFELSLEGLSHIANPTEAAVAFRGQLAAAMHAFLNRTLVVFTPLE